MRLPWAGCNLRVRLPMDPNFVVLGGFARAAAAGPESSNGFAWLEEVGSELPARAGFARAVEMEPFLDGGREA